GRRLDFVMANGPAQGLSLRWGNMQGGVISHSCQLIFALTSSGLPLPSELLMSMDALGVTITNTLNLNQYLVIGGATSCTIDFCAPNICNKSDIYSFLSQNRTLSPL
ncbi:MAG: hypothetical protein ACKPKO_56815, partial [Candidatus Fonsibacter sp.]